MNLETFHSQINLIFNEFDREKQAELFCYFIALLNEHIADSKITKNKLDALFLLMNLKEKEEEITRLQEKYYDIFIREIRKDILENIKYDYTKDFPIIYRPENWICRLIKKLKELLGTEKNSFIEILNEKILGEICKIFFSKEKFRTGGNMLYVNLIFYEKNFMAVDEKIYKQIENNFHENCSFGLKNIKKNF